MLRYRGGNDQTIQVRIDVDLACQPRRVPQFGHQIQHIHLTRGARAHPFGPGGIDVNVAGGACAVAPTIPVNAGDPVIGGGAHERCTRDDLDGATRSVELDEGYFWH
jgi:hypothetical protein